MFMLVVSLLGLMVIPLLLLLAPFLVWLVVPLVAWGAGGYIANVIRSRRLLLPSSHA